MFTERVRGHQAGNVGRVTVPTTVPLDPTLRVAEPCFLAGTAAVALVLALSRWGTNIGTSPFFITDILIGLCVVHLVITHLLKGGRSATGLMPSSAPSLLFKVFFVYIVARFLLSAGQGPILDWVRDGVPFLYGIMAFIGARAMAVSGQSTRARTMALFWWALIIHLIWTSFSVLANQGAGFVVPGPLFSAPLFELRPDIDSALVAVAVGMLLRHCLTHKRRFWALAALILGIVTVFSMGTRAGLVSVFIALAVSFFITYSSLERRDGRRIFMVLLVPAVVIGLAAVLPITTPGQRLLTTFNPSGSYGEVQDEAAGTQRARELTWTMVIEWTNEDLSRQLLGSGFGNDFLEESGSKVFLEGTTYNNVRSPHNWFIGIYARMGIVGALFAGLTVIQIGLLIWTNRQRVGREPLLAMSALIVCSILPVASLGVVLEAPFGAVPFFWSAGLLMTLARHPSQIQPRSNPRRE